MAIRRLDESHVPVPRRTQDRDPGRLKSLASRVDILDPVRKVPEEAPGGIRVGLVPVVGELDLRRVAWVAAAQENEREAALLVHGAARLGEAELFDEEIECSVEIADSKHGVQVAHGVTRSLSPPNRFVSPRRTLGGTIGRG